MSKSKFFVLLIVICSILISVFPTAAQSVVAEKEITLQDDLEREITLTLPLNSIVSLAPSVTETLCAIGLCEQLSAVDINSNYPESIEEIEKITNMSMVINLEAIITLDPDVIIATELTSPDQIKSLEDMGLVVFYIKNPKALDDLDDFFLKFGELTGHEEEAEKLAADMIARMDAIEEKLKDVEVQPVVFYEIDATDPAKPWTTSDGTFVDELITRAGGKNVASGLTGEWVQISLEKLIQDDPEIIVLADSNYGVTLETVEARVGWDTLTAVKEGNVFPIDSDIGSRPGPRLIDALDYLVSIFHPEIE